MEKIVIADTDVIIDFFSGTEPAASVIEQLILQDSLALTSITVFELYAGITRKKRIKQIDNNKILLIRTAGWILFVLAFTVFSVQAEGEVRGEKEGHFYSLQLVTGLMYSPVIERGKRPTLNYSLTALRLGYKPGGIKQECSIWKGGIEWLVEAVYSSVNKGAGEYMAGMTILFRYNFIRYDRQFIPYVQAGAGMVYNDIYRDMSQTLVGQSIEFTPQAGLGVHFLLNKKWSIDLETLYHHVSNAGLANRDVGVNSLGCLLGMTMRI